MSAERFRTSLRIALAMVLAYGISLWLDWDKPYWAGLAVAMCALVTDGESLQKSLLRMLGTVHAAAFALLVLAAFPQDRWTVIVCLTLHAGLCAYMMGGTRRWYHWFHAAYVSVMLGTMSDAESLRAFEVVTLRTLQTLLGILCYMAFATVIMPTDSRGPFEADLRKQVATLRALLAEAAEVRLRGKSPETLGALRDEALRLASILPGRLDAAQLDSFEIWETRREWRRAVARLDEIARAADRWIIGFAELKDHAKGPSTDRLAETAEELDRRFEGVSEMLEGRGPPSQPQPVASPSVAEDDGRAHFHLAAVMLARRRLREIDRASEDLFHVAADLSGHGPRVPDTVSAEPEKLWIPDPDRLEAAVRVMAGFLAAYLVYIYVPGTPSYITLLVHSLTIGQMTSVKQPGINPAGVLPAAVLSCGIGGAAHLLIMPNLEGFSELGAMVFLIAFAICWLFHAPRLHVVRTLSLAMFAVISGIANDQSYSFTHVADSSLAFIMAICLVAACRYAPISFAPRHGLQRTLAGYVVSAVTLMETMHVDRRKARSWLERQRRAFHERRVAQAPERLAMWAGALGGGPETRNLAADMDRLSKRLQDWLALREAEHAEDWVRELTEDVRAWRLAVEEALRKLAASPESLSADVLRERLSGRLERMEMELSDAIRRGVGAGASEAQGEALYSELGGLRGVSEALVSAVETAGRVDWPRLRENRF